MLESGLESVLEDVSKLDCVVKIGVHATTLPARSNNLH